MKNITLLGLAFTFIFLQSCTKQKDCVCTDASGNSETTGSIKTNSSSRIHKFETDCKASSIDYYNNGVYTGSSNCTVK